MIRREVEEIEAIKEIESLQNQFQSSLQECVASGDLRAAKEIQARLESKIAEVKDNYERFKNLHPEMRRLVEKGEVKMMSVKAGGKSLAQLKEELQKNEVSLFENVSDLMKSSYFLTLPQRQKIDLVVVSPSQLNLDKYVYLETVLRDGESWGLQLCPPEVGVELRLTYRNQPVNEELIVAMPYLYSGTLGPRVFTLLSGFGNQLKLSSTFALSHEWVGSQSKFLFRV